MLEIILLIIWKTAFLWIPLIISIITFRLWLYYRREIFLQKQKWVMLEINIPKDVFKTPQAMEIFLISLQQGQVGHWYDKFWKGSLSAWFSLEIASIEGNLYFFVRTIDKYKNIVESQIYGQYPKAEIHEVDDYTKYVPNYDPESDWDVWGTEFALKDKDAIPIKTYVDYGLDKSSLLDSEQIVDPLASILEFMGSMDKDEQMWLQFLVKKESKPWRKEAKELIDELMQRDDKSKKKTEDGNDDLSTFKMTHGEQEKIKAIEKSLSKPGFDCGIRGLYIFHKDAFRLDNIFGLLTLMQPFNSEVLNKFGARNPTGYVYPWQDYKKMRSKTAKKNMFEAYVARSYFYQPYHITRDSIFHKPQVREHFILTTEELATLFRFPSKTTETPSIERVTSVKSAPPGNLPV